jgi:hypothetical protein
MGAAFLERVDLNNYYESRVKVVNKSSHQSKTLL